MLNRFLHKGAVYVKATSLPMDNINTVYHVGDLNPENKGTESYEGSGLSVSQYPEEWAEIAELPGEIWTLSKSSGSFLDALVLSNVQKKELQDWGINSGYLETKTIWRMYYYDSEMEEERYFEFTNQKDAEIEFEDYSEEDPDARLEEIPESFIGTQKLAVEGMNQDVMHSEGIAWDILLTLYVEHETNLDGVWWHERLDVLNLSAPRGVIVSSKISQWKISDQYA